MLLYRCMKCNNACIYVTKSQTYIIGDNNLSLVEMSLKSSYKTRQIIYPLFTSIRLSKFKILATNR